LSIIRQKCLNHREVGDVMMAEDDNQTVESDLASEKQSCCSEANCCGPSDPFVRHQPKIGRNDPCPCGNGRKFKKCCGKYL